MKLRITGSKKNPFDMPKMMIPTQSLKNTTNTYELEGPKAEMASRVEKPPWKTLEPI